MITIARRFLLLFLLGIGPVVSAQEDRPYVILISFDGFRHDYVRRYNLTHFKEFIEKGSQAKSLIPSFPSKTFPNHYTLVTGLYPGHHGLVDNGFYDRKRNEIFAMRYKERVSDPYYYGGVPLWQLAYRNHMRSASYFWVGSELPQEGLHPDYAFKYDEKVPFLARIDQALEWLNLPDTLRPHLITLYFSSPDHEAHTYGPLSPETQTAVMRSDSLLGHLMSGLSKISLPVNVVLVSDHGMKGLTVQDDTYTFLDEMPPLRSSRFKVINNGTQAHVYTPTSAATDSLYLALKKIEKKIPGQIAIVRKENFLARWHYQNDRCGDLLIMAKPGHYLINGNRKEFFQRTQLGSNVGVHGYDPMVEPDVHGIFYAKGPNVKAGVLLPSFENIHVYPFIAMLLQLKTPPIDGKEEVLKGIYRK